MRNPLKRALIRLRRPPFEGRWAPEVASPFDMLIHAHDRLSKENAELRDRTLDA